MKKIVILLLSVAAVACGGESSNKKESFQYKRLKTIEQKAEPTAAKTPADLNNKGIGPIDDLVFDTLIDDALAANGASIFKQKCTACHKTVGKLIGPEMQGIYERRHPAWVMNIMLNPTQMLKEDPIAKALLAEYNNVLMINQNLTVEEARALAEYLRTL